MRTSLLSAAALLLSVSCVTAPKPPPKVVLPPGTDPYAGCQRSTPNPSDHVFTCPGWTADYSEVEGATPAQLVVENGRDLKAHLNADVAEDTTPLTIGGKVTPVARYTARNGEKVVSVSYLAAQAQANGATHMVTCTVPEGAPEGLARCELAMDSLLTHGLPARTEAPERVKVLLGEAASKLPHDCVFGGGLTPTGGRVRCGERLVLRWDGVPDTADALTLDNYAAGLQGELGGGAAVERDTPPCTVKGAEAVCIRLKVRGGYTFLLAQKSPPGALLVNCGYQDRDPDGKAICEGLITLTPPSELLAPDGGSPDGGTP